MNPEATQEAEQESQTDEEIAVQILEEYRQGNLSITDTLISLEQVRIDMLSDETKLKIEGVMLGRMKRIRKELAAANSEEAREERRLNSALMESTQDENCVP